MTAPDADPTHGPRAQCPTCRGSGFAVRQISVVALDDRLDGRRGGTGLVHVTCTTCAGEGWQAGFAGPV